MPTACLPQHFDSLCLPCRLAQVSILESGARGMIPGGGASGEVERQRVDQQLTLLQVGALYRCCCSGTCCGISGA